MRKFTFLKSEISWNLVTYLRLLAITQIPQFVRLLIE